MDKKEREIDSRARQAFSKIVDVFEKELNFSREKLIDMLLEKPKDQIPVSIFNNTKLSAFEAIVKHLREKGMKNKDIALQTNRSQSAVASTYLKAKKKMPERLQAIPSEYDFPITIISIRSDSVLESIVKFLHDRHKLGFSLIARMLHRDQRTIWTTYHRKRYHGR